MDLVDSQIPYVFTLNFLNRIPLIMLRLPYYLDGMAYGIFNHRITNPSTHNNLTRRT